MSDVRQQVYAVFQAVLGVAEVAGQNFFDLGGDSLQALDIASQVEEQLGRDFPLEELFATGDIDTVAGSVAEQPA